ncbi:MAG TPA: hypothetical protein VMX97_12000, partial [Hyphomicrobiaceae bacterium]|nr:hypothetical protein [Hyphomicrobiaceae bacterium]
SFRNLSNDFASPRQDSWLAGSLPPPIILVKHLIYLSVLMTLTFASPKLSPKELPIKSVFDRRCGF